MTRHTLALRLIAGFGFVTLLVVGTAPASAQATAPTLIATAPNAIVAGTYTNALNTGLETAIRGDVCFTGPLGGVAPISVIGSFSALGCPLAMGNEQNSALVTLGGNACPSLGAAVTLNSSPGHPTGIYGPGCYSSTGAMTITGGTTVTLNGAGVYVFRSGGALSTGANSVVTLAGGACANDVFWTPVGATTLGANAITSPAVPTFVGNIFRGNAAGLSITLGHFAHLTGRALAFGSTVTTDSNTIDVPTCPAFGSAGGGGGGGVPVPVPCVAGTGPPPTITAIPSQTIPVTGGSVAVGFTIGGAVITDALIVRATSSDTTLVPASAMTITNGIGGARVLTISGADGRSGVTTITITVTDPTVSVCTAATTTTFQLTVGPVAVPTLPEWAFLATAGLLLLAGIIAMRRRLI